MNIRWLTNPAASCFYAVQTVLRQQPLVEPALAEAFEPAVVHLAGVLAVDQVIREVFLTHLVPFSLRGQSKFDLARQIFTKTDGRERAEAMAPRYRGHFIDVELAYQKAAEGWQTDLTKNLETLKHQWLLHGPGLLAGIKAYTEAEILVSEAEVVAVPAVRGGGGSAYPTYNLVVIEAPATDPAPELPEVLRLAWLLAQLSLDLPRYADAFSNALRAASVGALALIPVTLASAADVKLATCDAATITKAVAMWLGADADTATKLNQWWDVYRDTRPAWPTALAALERL